MDDSQRSRILARFMEKVCVGYGGDCWSWLGAAIPTGYGHFGVNGKAKKAHRISYELFVGPIPDGMHVCHSCDTPACVNPDHLWIGTHRANAIDMNRKGRNAATRLTESDVRQIRNLAGLVTRKALGRMFGVDHSTIGYVIRRQTWAHVT